MLVKGDRNRSACQCVVGPNLPVSATGHGHRLRSSRKAQLPVRPGSATKSTCPTHRAAAPIPNAFPPFTHPAEFFIGDPPPRSLSCSRVTKIEDPTRAVVRGYLYRLKL